MRNNYLAEKAVDLAAELTLEMVDFVLIDAPMESHFSIYS